MAGCAGSHSVSAKQMGGNKAPAWLSPGSNRRNPNCPLITFSLNSLTLVGKSMARLLPTLYRFGLPLVLAALCLHTLGDQCALPAPVFMPFAAVMPQTVVWAWEEAEDLRLAPTSVGVAYLAETLFVGQAAPGVPKLTVLSRHQPLAVAPGAAVMAVVRLIALPGFQDSGPIREQTATELVEIAHRSGLRALQVDFDATRSQRAFYASVLTQLRPRMPATMPLSITALLSWCAAGPGTGDWLSTLPIDEAVPMFFRLGGTARSGDHKSGYPLREPHCRGSIGISTDESWPQLRPHARIYLFAPRPWTERQLAALPGIRSNRVAALQFEVATANHIQPNDTGLPSAAKPAVSGGNLPEERWP